VPIYKPTSSTTFTKTSTAKWADIKAMTDPVAVDIGNYVLKQGNNLTALTGDICNFIDDDYRLPNWSDFLPSMVYADGIVSSAWNASSPVFGGWWKIDGSWSHISATNNEGTFIIPYGASFFGINSFPVSGYRSTATYGDRTGSLQDMPGYSVGISTYYMSGSVISIYSSAIPNYFAFQANSAYSGGTTSGHAGAVRCVKN
jgi:hypothetical protein